MKKTLCILACAVSGMVFAISATAQVAVISDKFTGDDPLTRQIVDHPFCDLNTRFNYREVGPIQVDTSGTYQLADIGISIDWDTVTSWHDGPFEKADPDGNLVGFIDDEGSINLQAGKDYYVVAQPWCYDFEGIRGLWAISVSGPGNVTGAEVYHPPEFMMGEFDGNEDLTNALPPGYSDFFGCVDSFYDVSGPHQFEQGGPYFVAPYSQAYGPGLWVHVYDAEFDPDNPLDNKVSDFFPMELEADTDYWFVTQPDCQPDTGPWAYVLFPSVPFAFNGLASGAYYDTMTPGQGELMEIDPVNGDIFLAMFTWTTEPPPASVNAMDRTSTRQVGDARQRWLTMQGKYEEGDGTVELNVYNTTGGVFNDPAPVETDKVGTAVLDMDSCKSGKLTFALDSGEEGMTMMTRLLPGNLEECLFRYARPDVLRED